MNEISRSSLNQIFDRKDLTVEETHALVLSMMQGELSELEIATVLTALRVKGETAVEITGAAQALRQLVKRVQCQTPGLLDTCGTGGDRLHTFNISTASALVVAACGVPVAKHGNRSATSQSGSSEVLARLGVRIELSAEEVARCIDEIGIGFCFAPLFHEAMRVVAPVRKQLEFRTLFNFLGPLANPASAEYQLIGTISNEYAWKLAHAIQQLGTKRTLVVCGSDQLDEVALWGQTAVFTVGPDSIDSSTWTAHDFGLKECTHQELRVSSPEESAEVLQSVFAGRPGPARDMVLANSAAALLAAGHMKSLKAGVERASSALDRGEVQKKLDQLVQWTNRTT